MSIWPRPVSTLTTAQLIALLNEKLPVIEQRGETLPRAVAGAGGITTVATTVARDALAVSANLIVYNDQTQRFERWNGTDGGSAHTPEGIESALARGASSRHGLPPVCANSVELLTPRSTRPTHGSIGELFQAPRTMTVSRSR